jgi:hypothetical protein
MSELPVDPTRLREEFPSLTDEDLEAYVRVTRVVMAAGKARSRVMREIIGGAQEARQKVGQGHTLSDEEQLWVHYLSAVEKMQRSTVR